MKKWLNCIFPSSNNLFWEGWRLFVVNYIWLLLFMVLLITVNYADKVGEPELKGVYQVLLGVLLLACCIAYCSYWYCFGFRLGQQLTNSSRLFLRGVILGLGAVTINLFLPFIIYILGFSKTDNMIYNLNVSLVQLLLFISVFLLPELCGLGTVMGWQKVDGTFGREQVSEKQVKN